MVLDYPLEILNYGEAGLHHRHTGNSQISLSSTVDSGFCDSDGSQKSVDVALVKRIEDDAPMKSPKLPTPPRVTYLSCLFSWCMLSLFAFCYALCVKIGLTKSSLPEERQQQKDFPLLYRGWHTLYMDFIYRRCSDLFARPITGTAAAQTNVLERVSYDKNSTFELPGGSSKVINLSSYNYLGFAHNDGYCSMMAESIIDQCGYATCSTYQEYGNMDVHAQLEAEVADFLNVEAAIVFPMGYATNSMGIPSLVDKHSLVLSDELNHASLIFGMRQSGAHVKIFRHDDAADCERRILSALAEQKYRKIIIIVEGLYSMEGTIVHLPEFVRLKTKYKCYLYVDEAHSIGSIGRTGRGVCEYWSVAHRQVDILMGTFTKSFAAAGGYIAGRKAIIDRVRSRCYGVYASTMSPPVAQQVISALRLLRTTAEGSKKLSSLIENTRYFRRRLQDAGFIMIGHPDSPVVPVFIFYPCKVSEFSRRLLKRGIGVVVVGFPVTPIASERIRFCISSDHTREHLDYVVRVCIEEADRINCRYLR